MERPIYIQPEDRINYRAFRILLICGILNTKNGLSKEVIACLDFLLRNSAYQKKFILEYYKDKKNLLDKLNTLKASKAIETDFNIIQYKSVPWDLRFNDMLLFLYIRNLIDIKGIKTNDKKNQKENIRILISDTGKQKLKELKAIFIDETNFLEIFGKSIIEDKVKQIITEVIPQSYWIENEKITY